MHTLRSLVYHWQYRVPLVSEMIGLMFHHILREVGVAVVTRNVVVRPRKTAENPQVERDDNIVGHLLAATGFVCGLLFSTACVVVDILGGWR